MSENGNFERALRPIFLWMKLIGFCKLQSVNEKPPVKPAIFNWLVSIISFMYSFFVVLLTGFVHVCNLLGRVQRPHHINEDEIIKTLPSSVQISIAVSKSNNATLSIGSCFIFFLVSMRSWKSLIRSLKNIQERMYLDNKFYRSCFKKTVILFIFLLFVSIHFRNSISKLNVNGSYS